MGGQQREHGVRARGREEGTEPVREGRDEERRNIRGHNSQF